MRITGTIVSKANRRAVKTKNAGTKTVTEVAILDEDGGIVNVQHWQEEGDTKTSPLSTFDLSDRISAAISGPSQYQGVTRASLAGEPAKA